MKTIFASFKKEWLLLWRDKMGLIFLFALPLCLILFVTLSSANGNDSARQLKLLLINKDDGAVGQALVKALQQVNGFKTNELPSDTALSIAEQQITEGAYQALLIIPKNLTQTISEHTRNMNISAKAGDVNTLTVYFDPALPKQLSQQIELSIRLLNKNIEANLFRDTVAKMAHRPAIAHPQDLIAVNTDYVKVAGRVLRPNDVQQNVPAWALFAMFFIITPLSGTIVKERSLHVMDRIHVAPVLFVGLIIGKIGAFVALNLVQLLLMLLIGVYILPLFGLPVLDVSHHPSILLVTGICASLAATGFGMFIGSLVRTPEQANVIGPFVIVIAAAVGGILVPMYLLPEFMQKIGAYSPLRWAHAAFLDVFIRDAGWIQLAPNLLRLLSFAGVTLFLALLLLTRRAR